MSTYLKYPQFESKVSILHQDQSSLECLMSPMEKNFSLAYANLLRRILLGHTVGHAVTAIQVKGISSEFESIPGVLEDTFEILMRIKNLVFHVEKPLHQCVLTLDLKGAHHVCAEHIQCPPHVSILNKDLHLFTMNDSALVQMSLLLQSGTGYYLAHGKNLPKGYIPFDCSFSPVVHVSYRIHSYSHYEEVLFHVRTNGSIKPLDAFSQALHMLASKSKSLLDTREA